MIHTIQFKNWVDEVLTEELGKEIASEGITKLEIMYEECTGISPFKNNNMEETLEEAAILNCESITHPYCDREKAMFIKGAKWMEERMYSEEEVLKILVSHGNFLYNGEELTLSDWFEQFKKHRL